MALYDRMHSTGYCVRLSAPQSEHMDILVDLLDRFAADIQLKSPDEAQILLRVEPGGSAAGQDPALSMQRAERGHPSVAAGEVDHNVQAAGKGAPMWFAVFAVDPLHE